MIAVRTLRREDAVLFRQIRLQGLKESPASFGASYAQEEKMPFDFFEQRIELTADIWVIGAFDGQALVGVIGFVRDSGDKSRHKGFIWGMYVVPDCRGKGIGRALFSAAMTRAEEMNGLSRVRLSVVTSNFSAIRLYEQFGFVRYGEELEALCVDGVFHSEYHMARGLKK